VVRIVCLFRLPGASATGNVPVKESVQAKDTIEVQNLASAFAEFWNQTKGLSTDVRVATFKRDIEARFPAFYGITRYKGKVTQAERDAQILRAIDKFEPMRDAYLKKISNFESQLQNNLSSFRHVFPDFQANIQVYLLHSLGEMDGGTRTLEDKNYLIFGIDGMVQYHKSSSDESAFFHHELFHFLHRPLLGRCEEIWCSLWREGLAVYVAKTMHPNASEDELLLTFPLDLVKNTEAKRREALNHLKSVLSSTDSDAYRGMFQSRGDSTGLPARRGYVLGLWVAQELAKTYSLQTLSQMKADQAKPLVLEAVNALIEKVGGDQSQH